MRDWTSCQPAEVAGSPIVHLGIEVIGPIRALAVAQNQDPRSEFGHLLEVTCIHNIHVSDIGSEW